jgi:hypothetical protein
MPVRPAQQIQGFHQRSSAVIGIISCYFILLHLNRLCFYSRRTRPDKTLEQRAAGPIHPGRGVSRGSIRANPEFLKINDNNRKKMISRLFITSGWTRTRDDAPILFDNLPISEKDQHRPPGRLIIS